MCQNNAVYEFHNFFRCGMKGEGDISFDHLFIKEFSGAHVCTTDNVLFVCYLTS